ncbi:TPA: GrlR family regulatory protein [Salmonella enterica subsp. enterica serovar Mississippi]
MKDGIYRVVFESSLPSFGEGIVVISDGKVHGGDIGFVCRGRLARPVMELSISQYDNELPSVLGMEGNYDLVLSEKRHLHRIVYRVRPRIMCFCASCYLCVLEDGRIRLSREGEMIVEYARSDAAYLLDDLPDVEPSGYSLPGGH